MKIVYRLDQQIGCGNDVIVLLVKEAVDLQLERRHAGLCPDCRHAHRVTSQRGSTFYRCQLSAADPTFPKYPSLPVVECAGYQQVDVGLRSGK